MKSFMTQTRIIVTSFLFFIFLGGILLSLPIASATNEPTSFFDALFTACSATTTTGLTTVTTGTNYSLFGHIVILFLMEIGGLGFITFLGFFTLVFHKKISLSERSLMKQAAGIVRNDSFSRLMKRIILVTIVIEGIGTILLSIRFVPEMGAGYGIFYSLFHVVSAFSNSGFDLCAQFGSASISMYAADPLVVMVIALVGFFGGFGFLVWDDMIQNGYHIKNYSLHSKIALTTTMIILAISYGITLLFEWNYSLADMSIGQKLLDGFFNTVSPLTSGYYVLSPALYSHAGLALACILMMIGGSPGSTAGGIKTTTIAILFINMFNQAGHKKNIILHKKRISEETINLSAAIFFYFIFFTLISLLVLTFANPQFSTPYLLTEVVAAITTDGLSTGITPELTILSKSILMVLMVIGRIGGLCLLYIFLEGKKFIEVTQRPTEDILVG